MREDFRGEDDLDRVPELTDEWMTESETEKRQRPEPVSNQIRTANIPNFQDVNEDVQDRDPDNEERDFGIDDDVSSRDNEEEMPNPEEVRRNPPRLLRGINRRYHGDEFISLATSDRMDYMLETYNLAFFATLDHSTANPLDHQSMLINREIHRSIDECGIMHDWHPLYLSSKASSEDNPTLREAMVSPERRGWEEAMEVELDALEKMKVYELVPRSSVTKNTILDTTWAFKRKRYPDGSIRKLKARLCVRGDQQVEGVDYFQTYAPVVQWSTVRTLLVLSVTIGLKSKQVDYTNAFVQVDIDTDVFVEMPPMHTKDGFVWKLKKSLYGLRESPLNFFEHLKQELEARSWTASSHDPCLFYKGKMTCLVYVDDCLFFGHNEDEIGDELTLLREPKPNSLSMSEESDVAGFLGILMEKTQDGIELKQEGLIKRIITSLGLEDCTPKLTPSERHH